MEAATLLDQQVHQCLTEIVRKREKGRRESKREGGRDGVRLKERTPSQCYKAYLALALVMKIIITLYKTPDALKRDI